MSGPTSESQLGWITEAEWTITIENKSQLPIDGLRSRPEVSIFRVPNSLMKESKNGEAYIPQRVSLGPYHHRSAKLRSMDSHKGRALNRMMMRYNTSRNFTNDPINMDMEFSVRAREEICKLENEIKKRYQEIISCDGETLSLMLSLDGCFILEILRTLGGEFIYEASNCYEPIFELDTITYTGREILRDILKLENQIPLTVLQKLLELELNQANVNEKVFQVLVEGLLGWIYPFTSENANMNTFLEEVYENANMNNFLHEGAQEVQHILGFCHKLIVSPYYHNGNRPKAVRIYSIHHAVELINVGIKFKPCTKGINAFQTISFDPKRATIYLPPIEITDYTEVLFRNLIAFEMCKPSETNYVACYVWLMDQLIDSEEDVTLLRRKGIVTNCLGSDGEAAKVFNGLCNGITVGVTDVFGGLTEKVNEHYKSEYKVQRAQFVRDHFSSVWKALAWAAAIFILVLTVVQTVCSILQVV